MPDVPPFGDVKPVDAREWDDPIVVPANEVPKYVAKGWEPCGPVMMQATNNDTGAKVQILAWGLKRRYSPVRNALEAAKGRVISARVATPPINGHR